MLTLTDKIKKALKADFDELYQKDFVYDWKVHRFLRSLEIGVMKVDNLEKLFSKQAVKR
jgi:ATP-dependent protease HslVU (ClpYQ) peptidase subunit